MLKLFPKILKARGVLIKRKIIGKGYLKEPMPLLSSNQLHPFLFLYCILLNI
jgi:hypothetical protein